MPPQPLGDFPPMCELTTRTEGEKRFYCDIPYTPGHIGGALKHHGLTSAVVHFCGNRETWFILPEQLTGESQYPHAFKGDDVRTCLYYPQGRNFPAVSIPYTPRAINNALKKYYPNRSHADTNLFYVGGIPERWYVNMNDATPESALTTAKKKRLGLIPYDKPGRKPKKQTAAKKKQPAKKTTPRKPSPLTYKMVDSDYELSVSDTCEAKIWVNGKETTLTGLYTPESIGELILRGKPKTAWVRHAGRWEKWGLTPDTSAKLIQVQAKK